MRPPFNLAAIDQSTDAVLALGHRIMQTHRYSESDEAHVGILLDILDPPRDAIILDAGCGVGEVSKIMSALRPDLSFVLMNLSLHQLSKCPTGEQYLHALDDCHATLLNDNSVDCVMFSSSLCQMDIEVALAEAHRMLKPGGVLMVNDMYREGGNAEELEQVLAARVLPQHKLLGMVRKAGFQITACRHLPSDSSHFTDLAKDAGIGHLVEGIEPIIIRATARKEH